ncbi:MAG: Holliday junction branch migration protein RuvA [Clostridia bacterium]|nr:Holliday junction branch migration protein RuvA [Clostridia bacterium]
MIAHIEGIISEKNADSVVVDCAGVGYELNVSAQTLSACPAQGKSVKLYSYLAVREDAMELFGFISKEEKKMFLRLIGVSGIGPRTALGVLGALSVHNLSVALVAGDANALARAPGIGKKTAQRLVLELKDKVETQELTGVTGAPFVPSAQSAEAEAIQALMALGYNSSDAAKAVSSVAGQSDKTNDIVFLALRKLGGGM